MKFVSYTVLAFSLAAAPVVAADFDLLITNARIVDGTGSTPINGSVAVKDGRIVAVGRVEGSADETIDAGGRVLAPGFIDVHTHSEKIAELPVAENFLRMGVTTIVTGNCGGSRTDVAAVLQGARGGEGRDPCGHAHRPQLGPAKGHGRELHPAPESRSSSRR